MRGTPAAVLPKNGCGFGVSGHLPVWVDQMLTQLGDAAGNSRFYRAEGNIENRGDVLVGALLEIIERNSGLIDIVHFGQGGQDVRIVDVFARIGGEEGRIEQ